MKHTGQAFTRSGPVTIKQARWRADAGPLDPLCGCPACRGFSRAYLSHLFKAEEMLGPILASLHNTWHLVGLVRDALAGSLPGALFAGGTEIYFTEVNRSRPDHSMWDALCFSITPQIHAFTDTDIVENLDAQAENVRSARAIET